MYFSLFLQSSSDPIRVWSSCLTKCSEVLESCVNVFSEVKEQSVLEEIAQAEEGRNKLKGTDRLPVLSINPYQVLCDNVVPQVLWRSTVLLN